MTERMSGHDVLLMIADWHTTRGQVPPQLSIPQALPAAERLVRALYAGSEPEPAALPARPAWDDTTRILATIGHGEAGVR